MITRTAKCARNYSDLMGAKKRWNSTTAAAAAALRLSRTKLLEGCWPRPLLNFPVSASVTCDMGHA